MLSSPCFAQSAHQYKPVVLPFGMDNSRVCRHLRKTAAALLRKAYGKDFEATLAARGQELWLLGLNSKGKRYIDICGTIEPQLFAAIQAKGFIDSDAGYKADAQNVLPLEGKKADIFLLNADHFSAPPARLEPLMVHELAHFLDKLARFPQRRAMIRRTPLRSASGVAFGNDLD